MVSGIITSTDTPFAYHGGGQHDTRGWLGGEPQAQPTWSPAPLPHQHRFADVETGPRLSANRYRRDDPGDEWVIAAEPRIEEIAPPRS